jgi:Polymerase beta, Nucleotidyltransferase
LFTLREYFGFYTRAGNTLEQDRRVKVTWSFHRQFGHPIARATTSSHSKHSGPAGAASPGICLWVPRQRHPRKYSDIDLAIALPQALGLRKLRQLKDAFEDSDLPIYVDIVDWSLADPDFKAAVLAQGMAALQ